WLSRRSDWPTVYNPDLYRGDAGGWTAAVPLGRQLRSLSDPAADLRLLRNRHLLRSRDLYIRAVSNPYPLHRRGVLQWLGTAFHQLRATGRGLAGGAAWWVDQRHRDHDLLRCAQPYRYFSRPLDPRRAVAAPRSSAVAMARRNAGPWTGLQCRLRPAILHTTMSSMWGPRTRARKPKAGPHLRGRCASSAQSTSTWPMETESATGGTYIQPMIRRRHVSFTSTAAIGSA